MISRGKVKDNISTYLLLLHWNVGKHLPLLSFWHILESSFPPPLNHGKDPWELPVEHFGSKHLVKLVKWRVREQCRPLGCNQSHPTAHRTGDKLEMVVLHVLRETFNIQFNHREGFNDSATSNWVLKLPKLLLNVKSLAVLSYPPGLPGKCRPAALRLQLWTRRNSRGWPRCKARLSHSAASSPLTKTSWLTSIWHPDSDFSFDIRFTVEHPFAHRPCDHRHLGLCRGFPLQKALRRHLLFRSWHQLRHLSAPRIENHRSQRWSCLICSICISLEFLWTWSWVILSLDLASFNRVDAFSCYSDIRLRICWTSQVLKAMYQILKSIPIHSHCLKAPERHKTNAARNNEKGYVVQMHGVEILKLNNLTMKNPTSWAMSIWFNLIKSELFMFIHSSAGIS